MCQTYLRVRNLRLRKRLEFLDYIIVVRNLAPGGRVEVAEQAYSYLETNGYSRALRRCATALKHDTSIIIGLSCIVITMLLYNTNATTKLMLPNYRKQHDTKN